MTVLIIGRNIVPCDFIKSAHSGFSDVSGTSTIYFLINLFLHPECQDRSLCIYFHLGGNASAGFKKYLHQNKQK